MSIRSSSMTICTPNFTLCYLYDQRFDGTPCCHQVSYIVPFASSNMIKFKNNWICFFTVYTWMFRQVVIDKFMIDSHLFLFAISNYSLMLIPITWVIVTRMFSITLSTVWLSSVFSPLWSIKLSYRFLIFTNYANLHYQSLVLLICDFNLKVPSERFELSMNGLKARCPNRWATKALVGRVGIEPTMPKQVFYRYHGYLSASRP